MTTLAPPPATAPPAAPRPVRTIRLGRTDYEVHGPSIRDPRLHNSMALLTVQACGQLQFDWELSIAQILVSILTCAAIQVVGTARRTQAIAWPASAMLTGNAIALLMRVEGTVPGDWWSMRGWYYFAGTGVLAMATKRFITIEGRHIFNPANIALVTAFLVLGTTRVNPQDFWFGPPSLGLAITYAVLIGMGTAVTRRLGLLRLAATFLAVFVACLAVLALAGRLMAARWHPEPLGGTTYWWAIATSPEVLIFAFFMITDPKTTPVGRVGRVAFGAAVGVCSAVLMAPGYSEFSVKVGFLAGLTVVTGVWPLVRRRFPEPGTAADDLRRWARTVLSTPARLGAAACSVAAIGALLVGLTVATPPGPPAAAAEERAARPEVAIAEASLPEVEVSDSISGVMADISGEEADQILVDALADLEIERQALAERDPKLAAAAATGPRLVALTDAIESGADPTVPGGVGLPPATIRSASLAFTRPGGQAIPKLVLVLDGEVDGTGAPFEATLVLAEIGEHHLIDDVQP